MKSYYIILYLLVTPCCLATFFHTFSLLSTYWCSSMYTTSRCLIFSISSWLVSLTIMIAFIVAASSILAGDDETVDVRVNTVTPKLSCRCERGRRCMFGVSASDDIIMLSDGRRRGDFDEGPLPSSRCAREQYHCWVGVAVVDRLVCCGGARAYVCGKP